MIWKRKIYQDMRVCFLNKLTASEGNLTATCNAV